MLTLAQEIAAAEVFAGLAPEYLDLITGCGQNVHFDAGVILQREGDPADVFYLIRRGSVALEVHHPGAEPIRILTEGPGEPVGWSWLFEPYRWHLDARTIQPCSLIALDGACLRGKCEQDPALGYELMRRFARCLVERLEATQFQLLDVYGNARVGV